MSNENGRRSGAEKRGGYMAGSKTPSQVKPPPPAFIQPKIPAKPAKAN